MSKKNPDEAVARLHQIMERLRSPNGCQWDAEQTPESLKPYLIEEAYEVIDAIDKGEPNHICEELGDLLLQIVFHAQIFKERGDFDLADIANTISKKLIRRHPHVFDTEHCMIHDDHNAQWEKIKAEEKKAKGEEPSLFGDIPRALPSLKRTEKFIEKLDRTPHKSPQTIDESLEHIRLSLSQLELSITSKTSESASQHYGQVLYYAAIIGKRLNFSSEDALHHFISSQIATLELEK